MDVAHPLSVMLFIESLPWADQINFVHRASFAAESISYIQAVDQELLSDGFALRYRTSLRRPDSTMTEA